MNNTQFPRTHKYNPKWIAASASGGANSLWLAEWLTSALHLEPGMRVLDLGCGRAASSIFLAREFGVQVWAADLWFSPDENRTRIHNAGEQDSVFPIHADARALPFSPEFFDVIVAIDSFLYFGTDDLYLNYIARFLKPTGTLAIAGAGFTRELEHPVPQHLRKWWTPDMVCLHSADWWSHHWKRTDIVDIDTAGTMPDGWQRWLDWQRFIAPDNTLEIEALEADRGDCLTYIRVIAHRRPEALLSEPVTSVPPACEHHPLLHSPAEAPVPK